MPVYCRPARATLLLAVILLAACSRSPPVQEMSDARQAIAAARDAGARGLAPAELASAEQRLGDAERYLRSGGYGQARRAALAAREEAVQAMRHSRAPAAPPAGP